ncbi:MAG: hypothetical protein KDA24_14895 [Deltaproteobacteria bacterium]|nr:hypothetical protein [Deltaproteobacteria bacterium]
MKTFLSTLLVVLLLPAAASAADFVYATGTTAATRWIGVDSADVGVTEEGQRMEVIFEEGDRLRVRLKGSSFGWIDRSAVSTEDPNPAEGAGALDLPQIQLGADGKLQLPPSLQLGEGGGLKLDVE